MVHRCTGTGPPTVLRPGSSHCACVPRHAERQTEQLLLAAEQPAGCVRVYPTLTTYLLNIHTINLKARVDSLKNEVKSEARKEKVFAEGRKELRKAWRKEGSK